MKSKFYKKLLFYLLIFLTVSMFLIQLILKFVFFPSEISLIVGQEQMFEFNIPAAATIQTDELTNININNERVENEKNISLREPFSVFSEDEGTADMRLSVMGIPVRNVKLSVIPNVELIPGGSTVGVRINTDGVMVLSVGAVKGADKEEYEPCTGAVRSGDLIISVNQKKLKNKEDLINGINNSSDGKITLEINRNGEIFTKVIDVVKAADGTNKIGLWVRDSTQGIGTVTYYNPYTGHFGALGHGIVDVDTKELMPVKDGKIMKSNIVSVNPGEKGNPGELIGDIESDTVMGKITNNTKQGIYGVADKSFLKNTMKPIPIGLSSEIKEGEAYILSNINNDEVKKYRIVIESINRFNTDSSKSMVIRITDPELLKETNGIVQGMSGSPIIQDDKLIGAVTHVFIQEPQKGYGIFIENMLRQDQ